MECTGCLKGIAMCHNRPCFGTPEEFEKIIDSGFAKKLRIDYYVGRADETNKLLGKEYLEKFPNPFKEDVLMLSGGTNSDINFNAPFWPTGTCKLLENDLCSLHSLGLKPHQGAKACCDDSKNEAEENIYYAHLWNTDKGREVIKKFKKAVGIED